MKIKKTASGRHSVRNLLLKAEQLLSSGQHDKSIELYKKIVKRAPRNHEALCGLAKSHAAYQEYLLAEKYLLRAIELNPGYSGYRIDLGRVYCSLFEWDKVIELNQSLLETDGTNVYVLFNMGYAWRGKGELEKSLVFFREIIRLQPLFYKVYSPLCAIYYRLDMIDELEELLQTMERIAPSLDSGGQSTLYFLLGLYLDYLDEYEKAFPFFEKGNRLKLGGARYDIDYDVDFIRRIARNMPPDFYQKNKKYGHADSTMIFIVGMPRSGTSLVEQILSCHPDVAAGGELPFFYREAFDFDYLNPAASCQKLADRYLQAVRIYKDGASFLTDKLPGNFLYAGLIALCFPNARIIHCVRDPMDTCFSCYKQNFHNGHYYSFALHSLGEYYNAYRQHMKHWHEVVPHHILDVRYEDVVYDFEEMTRKIIDYCGLPWSDECLHYHESSRFVETASRDQVTKPIYDSSVQRWKHYEQQLQPLRDSLRPSLAGS